MRSFDTGRSCTRSSHSRPACLRIFASRFRAAGPIGLEIVGKNSENHLAIAGPETEGSKLVNPRLVVLESQVEFRFLELRALQCRLERAVKVGVAHQAALLVAVTYLVCADASVGRMHSQLSEQLVEP